MSRHQTADLRSNIPRLSVYLALHGGMFFVPIWVLFMQDHGLSYFQILLAESIYALSMGLWQIPSGYFSDLYGRRSTLFIASLASFLSMLAYVTGAGFWGFVMGNVLLATGMSFNSGTVEALAYETLLANNKAGTFRTVVGHLGFVRFTAEAVGSLLGGWLALHHISAPFWAMLLPYGFACFLAMTVVEPPRDAAKESLARISLRRICLETLGSPALRGIILLDNILCFLCMMLFWFTQPYQQEIFLPLSLFGLSHAVVVITGGTASKYVHVWEKWISDRTLYLVLASMVIGSYLILGLVSSIYGLLLFVIARAAWGSVTPLTNDLITRMTSPGTRATILSIRGCTYQILFMLLAPLFGLIADRTSIHTSMLIAGTSGGIALGMVFLLMQGVWKRIPAA